MTDINYNNINPYPVTYNDASDLNSLNNLSKIHFRKNISRYGDILDNDGRYICSICGQKYSKTNRSKHVKTNVHQFATTVNKKWRDFILG